MRLSKRLGCQEVLPALEGSSPDQWYWYHHEDLSWRISWCHLLHLMEARRMQERLRGPQSVLPKLQILAARLPANTAAKCSGLFKLSRCKAMQSFTLTQMKTSKDDWRQDSTWRFCKQQRVTVTTIENNTHKECKCQILTSKRGHRMPAVVKAAKTPVDSTETTLPTARGRKIWDNGVTPISTPANTCLKSS